MEKTQVTPIGRGQTPYIDPTRVAVQSDLWQLLRSPSITSTMSLGEFVRMSQSDQSELILQRAHAMPSFPPELMVYKGEVFQLLPVRVIVPLPFPYGVR